MNKSHYNIPLLSVLLSTPLQPVLIFTRFLNFKSNDCRLSRSTAMERTLKVEKKYSKARSGVRARVRSFGVNAALDKQNDPRDLKEYTFLPFEDPAERTG